MAVVLQVPRHLQHAVKRSLEEMLSIMTMRLRVSIRRRPHGLPVEQVRLIAVFGLRGRGANVDLHSKITVNVPNHLTTEIEPPFTIQSMRRLVGLASFVKSKLAISIRVS